jgi:trehalose-6-phosphatase
MTKTEIQALSKDIGKKLSAHARKTGLGFRKFDGGLEIFAPSRTKGDAIRTLLSEMNDITNDNDNNNGEPIVAYLGDDRTDEDAFLALQGKGLGVLVRSRHRKTAAGLWCKPPDELLEFLEKWMNACGGGK